MAAPTGGYLVRKSSLLAKSEGEYGTDSTPGAGDAVLAMLGDSAYSVEAKTFDVEAANGEGINEPTIVGSYFAKMAFETFLKGSGAAGTAPEIGDLLEACGLDETVSVGSSVTYKSVLGSEVSATIKNYEDGMLKSLLGAVGTLTINFEAGAPVKISFEFSGLYDTLADASFVAPTLEATEAAKWTGAAFTLGGDSLIVKSMSIQLGAQVVARESANGATGYQGFKIVAFAPTGTVTFEAEKVADAPTYADWLGNTSQAITTQWGDTGNKCQVNLDVCRLTGVTEGSADGVRTYECAFSIHPNAGGDAIEIALT